MHTRLIDALIKLAVWVASREAMPTPREAREFARAIAQRDGLDGPELQRLIRSADAITAPLPLEDL